jgi:ornithine cyclodeaminase/alanine dehydrogenase-like protein (mu-crystallin family)
MADCIAAVEAAFAQDAAGRTIPAGVLGTHVSDGGFHVKTAGVVGPPGYFVAKINANFPGNPGRSGLPTIQGVLVLFDAANGVPLAIMDSAEITRLRTAAASAVAAKYLALDGANTLTICGCGLQARSHLDAIGAVRPLARVFAYDVDPNRARRFAEEARSALGIDVSAVTSVREGSLQSSMIATCTPSRTPIIGIDDVAPGTFIAAVGADSDQKQEIDAPLMATSTVVVDVLRQCAEIGDLHHALEAGVMTEADVRADLASVVMGTAIGRTSDREIIIFDSTGTALEDVAAAALVYQRALATGAGSTVELSR